jgi:hypothetical protein
VKAEQVVNGFRAVTGTIEADFTSKAALYDSFTAKTELTLQFKLTSSTIIASATPFSFQVDVPALYLEGETPNVTGPDTLKMSIPFTVFYDDTNSPVSFTYVTSDTSAT